MEILAGSLLTPETLNDTDWPIQDTDIESITKRDDRPHCTLDQRDLAPYGNVSCFYTAAFKACADTFVLDAAERKLAVQAWKDGWAAIVKDGKVTPGFGGRLSEGVDYSRRAWNKAFPNKKVKSYRGLLPRFDQDNKLHQHFYRAINYGWQVMFGAFLDKDFSTDKLDGVVNNDTVDKDNNWGHARNLYAHKADLYRVNDNYPKDSGNSYLIDDLELKVKNGVIFPSYYIYLPA